MSNPLTLDPSESQAKEGTLVSYEWDVDGDGLFDYSLSEPNPITHIYKEDGSYKASLRVTDTNQRSDIDTINIKVRNNSRLSKPKINSLEYTREANLIAFSGNASDDVLNWEWDFEGSRGNYLDSDSGRVQHRYLKPGYYRAELKVSNRDNLQDRKTIFIKIANKDIPDIWLITPKDGDVVKGNSLTLLAGLKPSVNISSLEFLYRQKDAPEFNLIGRVSHPTYALYWDTTGLSGEYEIIARDADAPKNSSQVISLTIDQKSSDTDIIEELNPDKELIRKEKLQKDKTHSVALSDATEVVVPCNALIHNEDKLIIKLIGKTLPGPALTDPNDGYVKPIDVYRQISLESNQSQFLKDITITMPYPDRDNNGIVDGTNVKEETLNIYSFNESSSQWEKLPDSVVLINENLVRAKTNHLSIFGIGGSEETSEVGGGAGGKKESSCFIATACYGTPLAKEVRLLLQFRDKYLLRNPLGRKFVKFYYQHSPKVAEYIKDKESLKVIVRFSLRPLLGLIKGLIK